MFAHVVRGMGSSTAMFRLIYCPCKIRVGGLAF